MAVNKKIVFSSEFKDNTQGFSKLQGNLDRLNKKLSFTQRNFGKIGSGLKKNFGKLKESIGVGTVFAGIGSLLSLNTAAEFEDELAKVKAVVKKATGEINKETGESITIPMDIPGLEKLEALSRKIGATTQFEGKDALVGMKLLGASNWDSDQITAGIEPILKLTGAAQVNSDIGLAQVSGDFSDVMSAYGVASAGVKDFGDQAAWAFSNSNQTLGELMEAMKIYAPTFKTLGIAKEDAMAMQMILSDLGTKGNVAGTALAGFASRMIKLPPEAENVIKSKVLPEEYAKFFDDTKDSVSDVMELFRLMLEKGFSKKEITTVLGQESGKYMISLVDEKNINKVLDRRKKLLDQGEDKIWKNYAEELNNKFLESFRGKLSLLKSSISELALVIAETGLLDALKWITDRMTDAVTAISKIPKPVMAPIVASIASIGTLFAGMFTYGLAKKAGRFSGVLGVLGKATKNLKLPNVSGLAGKINLSKILDIGNIANLLQFRNLVKIFKPLRYVFGLFRFMLGGVIAAVTSSVAYLGWFAFKNWDKIKKRFPWIKKFAEKIVSIFEILMEKLTFLSNKISGWVSSAGTWLKSQFLEFLGDPENKAGWEFNPFGPEEKVSPHKKMDNANHNQKVKVEKEKSEISLRLDIKGAPEGSKVETRSNNKNMKFDVYLGDRGVAWS